jgi:hypothetical protein
MSGRQGVQHVAQCEAYVPLALLFDNKLPISLSSPALGGTPFRDAHHTVDYDHFIKPQLARTKLTLRPRAVQIGSRNACSFEPTKPWKSDMWVGSSGLGQTGLAVKFIQSKQCRTKGQLMYCHNEPRFNQAEKYFLENTPFRQGKAGCIDHRVTK